MAHGATPGDKPVFVLSPLSASEPPRPLACAALDKRTKSLHIRHDDLEKWGYTQKCPRCYKMCLHQSARGFHHTPYCCARVELAMAEAGDSR